MTAGDRVLVYITITVVAALCVALCGLAGTLGNALGVWDGWPA